MLTIDPFARLLAVPCRRRRLRARSIGRAAAHLPSVHDGHGLPLLPWAEGNQWHLPQPDYDRATLVADTLELLSVDAPILVRMENMRRAAIYADENPSMAADVAASRRRAHRDASRPTRGSRRSNGSTRAILSRPIGSSA